jgi:hypothetical protein
VAFRDAFPILNTADRVAAFDGNLVHIGARGTP